MNAMLLKDTGAVSETKSSRPVFFDPETLPWLPWVMQGTYFKLLNIDPMSGGFTLLLKVDGDALAPIHGHVGALEGVLLAGGMGYGADRGRAGAYMFELGGINHRPEADDDGVLIYATARGPISGYAEDGSVAGLVDARFMYELAAASGAAGHIPKPADW